MSNDYSFPVYSTEHGGVACNIYNLMRFIEAPEGLEYKMGDDVPNEWALYPANQHAYCEIHSTTPEELELEHQLERAEHAATHRNR